MNIYTEFTSECRNEKTLLSRACGNAAFLWTRVAEVDTNETRANEALLQLARRTYMRSSLCCVSFGIYTSNPNPITTSSKFALSLVSRLSMS